MKFPAHNWKTIVLIAAMLDGKQFYLRNKKW